MKKTVIVMPVANEEASMESVLQEVLALPYDDLYLYVIMDGYSRDNTAEIVKRYEQKTKGKIRYIFYKKSHGVISCYLEGFRRALADHAQWIIEMDGGGSHSPKQIPQFIEGLEEGYDCIWGSRFMEGGGISNHPFYRRVLSRGGTILANLVLGTGLRDMTSGFEAFQADVLAGMDLDRFLSTGHMYQTEMRYYCRNLRTKEVPIHYTGSTSGIRMKSVTEAVRILFQLKKNEKWVMRGKQNSGAV